MPQHSRRRLLTGAAVLAPAAWATPAVETVIMPAHAQTSDPCADALGFEPFSISVECVNSEEPDRRDVSFGIDDFGECPRWVTGAEVGDNFDTTGNTQVEVLPRTQADLLEWVISVNGPAVRSNSNDCGDEPRQGNGTFTMASATGNQQWEVSYSYVFTADTVTLSIDGLARV